MVNELLDSKILVIYKPNDGDSDNDRCSTSFIDLGIYNKDCALRLTLSSKITSPNRLLVPVDENTREEKEIIMDSLIVPNKKNYHVIEIMDKEKATTTAYKTNV